MPCLYYVYGLQPHIINNNIYMQKVTKPKVTPLQKGGVFATKQMEAKAGDLLPRHKASLESVLIVIEGECNFELEGVTQNLKAGTHIIVPKEAWHQIQAVKNLRAIHIMPKNISFDFES